MRVSKSGLYIDNPSAKLLDWLGSYEGVTDADGNAAGTTIRCSGLATEPSYSNTAVKLLIGPCAGQVRGVISHPAGTDTLTAAGAFTNVAGAAQQIVAGTIFIILSTEEGGISAAISMLARPRVSLLETWQDELGIDFTVWTTTNPATGAAWSRGAVGAYLRATSVPVANEIARLRSVQRWVAAPDVYGVNTILRRLVFEFEMRLANLANLDNTQCLFGLTQGVADVRATPNIIGWALVGAGNALQTVTDDAGVETVNTGFGETLTNWNKFRIDVLGATVRFYLNEALVATHITNLPDFPFYLNFFVDTNAGGAATPEIGIVRVWTEDFAGV